MNRLEDRLTPAGQVTGRAFLDFNANGLFNNPATITNNGFGTVGGAVDIGVQNVVVTAFDAAGASQGLATTDVSGNYTLSLGGTGPYRLEFGTPGSGNFFGPQGSGSSTAVQFVPEGDSTDINLSITQPAAVTTEANPNLWTSLYTIGAAFLPAGADAATFNAGTLLGAVNGSVPGMVRFPYSAGTTQNNNNTNAAIPDKSTLITIDFSEVGSTWGLAYNRRTDQVLSASYTKKHAGYGPLGAGGIYLVNNQTGAVSTFWDAPEAALGGGAGSLAEARAAYTTNDDYFIDSADLGWDAVGKSGFGGLATNEEGTIAYAMNLFDRQLYIIPINADGTANTAAISSVLVPTPSNATGTSPGDALGDTRPFAVEFHNGRVYVGMVNSAESTQNTGDLRAYVYEFTPAGNSGSFGARSILNESAAIEGVLLNYSRGASFGGADDFRPWSSTYARVGTGTSSKYPQPMLTGLAFDAAGNLTLGLRDRNGDQTGRFVRSDLSTNELREGVAAGDLLKTFRQIDGTYLLESGGVGSSGTNGQGPGGGEFYGNDNYANQTTQPNSVTDGGHNEVTVGGIVSIPGYPDVLSTVYDPVQQNVDNNFRSGGVRWMGLSGGTLTKAYYLYETDEGENANGAGGTFGKANGVGDLIAARQLGSIEIGNRIWNDDNGNGRQDPGEAGIQNIQVVLRIGSTVLGTATTDTNGEYYFSNGVPTTQTTGSKVFGNFSGTGAYSLFIDASQSPLTFTDANVATPGFNDQNDSDVGVDGVIPVTVPQPGSSNHSYDAGFRPLQPGSLSGFVYVDSNDDGSRVGEVPIAGVTVTLFRVVGGATTSVTATTTNGSGFYQFGGLEAGVYEVRETQPAAWLDGQDTAGTAGGSAPQDDRILSIPVLPNADSPENNFGERGGTISGFEYEDEGQGGVVRNDGLRSGSEPGIGGTTVTLLRVSGGTTSTLGTQTTGSDGSYSFGNLPLLGGYRVVAGQPADYIDGQDTPGIPGGGSASPNDAIDGISLAAGRPNSPDNNFGELLGRISGQVYVDEGQGGGVRNDGIRSGAEPAIAGATVTLFRVVGGATTSVTATTTGSDGSYEFARLVPGTYEVVETQPSGFSDGLDTAGPGNGATAGQDEAIRSIGLGGSFDADAPGNDFGELFLNGSLSGFVYEDNNDDGVKDVGENGIAGTTLVLTRVIGGTTTTIGSTTTAGDGSYSFTGLLPGDGYIVTETQPLPYIDGRDTPDGSNGTAPQDDTIRLVTVPVNGSAPNNNFGEIARGQLSGVVFHDEAQGGGIRNDGLQNGTEPGISGATLTLFRVVGTATTSLGQTTTDANGAYRFTGLEPGTGYIVAETQPAGFADGLETVGTTTGTAAQDERITGITVPINGESFQNNFAELTPNGSISGFVYEDPDNDGSKDAGEAAISGATLTLFRVVGTTTTSLNQTTTDATGFYRFDNLLAGGGYRVVETQPAPFLDGLDSAPDRSGTPFGQSSVLQDDAIRDIIVVPAGENTLNNFGELRPARLSGFVYEDDDNDGIKDPTEAAIPGTVVVLTGTDDKGAVTQTATTGADGKYSFENLRPGTYKVTESQPSNYLDGKDTAGSKGGSATDEVIDAIPLVAGDDAIDNNFGELKPARLSGFVYVDSDDDGTKDPGEVGLPNIVVVLTGVDDRGQSVTLTATTGTQGDYGFGNLRPGTYTVNEPTQPAGYPDGKDTAGSKGGTVTNENLAAIPLVAGDSAVNNNFGERPNDLPGIISGSVYEDADNDGIKDPGEKPIPGTTITLFRDVNGVFTSVATTTTNASGDYSFTGLPPATYAVFEKQPANYIDGKDSIGSLGGQPGNDQFTAIVLPSNGSSTANNFGEIPRNFLYGYVWIDQNQNGIFDPGEKPVPNALVTINGTAFSGTSGATTLTQEIAGIPLTSTTDNFGRWQFTSLPPGTYTVNQTNTPSGLSDFRSQNDGSDLPIETSSNVSFGNIALNQNPQGALNFGKVVPGDPITQPGRSPSTGSGETSKRNFLGSTSGSSGIGTSNQFVTDPTTQLNTTPAFAVTTGGTTPTYVVATAGAGYLPIVRVFDYSTGGEKFRFNAFDNFTGGVVSATGDITGDGIDDIIVGASKGGGPRVKVYDGATGAVVRDYFAYTTDFAGGVWLASGDFDNDGRADIVTGAGEGGGSHVKIWSGATGGLIREFFAFDPSIGTGARVAVGDFNGDGRDDIVAGTGGGSTAQYSVYNGVTLSRLANFVPYDDFQGGIFVAAGDVDGDGIDEIITAAGQGGGPRVRTTRLNGTTIYDGFVAETTFSGGIRLASKDVDGDGKDDIIAGNGIGGLSLVQIFSGANFGRLESFFAFDSGVKTGVYVG